jgi:RNA-directed DNA polymerase
VKEDTTGEKHFGFELTPFYPLFDLVDLIGQELQPTEEEKSTLQTLLAQKLPPLIRSEVLALILGISPKLLYAMAHSPEKYYRRFELPKRGGGTRQIATPRVFLKVVQRWILKNILYRRPLPEFVTGFVPHRGILINARLHVGHRYLLRLDVKDFFPSIRFKRVKEVYSQFGFSDQVNSFLAGLSTLGGVLPQGAPTSPYIANLAFLPCDLEMKIIAERENLNYSRYADDLTFSSENPIRPIVVEQLRRLIEQARFRVNEEKVRAAGPGQRLFTTGLVVNVKAQPLRTVRRNLRARFHQARLHPRRFVKEAQQLLGWAAYVKNYDPIRGNQYLRIANEVLTLSVSRQPKKESLPRTRTKLKS